MGEMKEWGSEASLIDVDSFREWILLEDEDFLVMNKPGWVVCHPSKRGPWSSLVGAAREYAALDRIHLVSRLDRETSGVVILAKRRLAARTCQRAIQNRQVSKSYLAVLEGRLAEPALVDQSLARDGASAVYIKQTVRRSRSAKRAVTRFAPLVSSGGFTLALVTPETGRKHQIRVHAQWINHEVAGDKIYGPDETLYLEFIESGWTARLARRLPHVRQLLHALEVAFHAPPFNRRFAAPLAADMVKFCNEKMGISRAGLSSILEPVLQSDPLA